MDEQGASLLADNTRIELLKQDVKPKIPEKAEALAQEVDKLLLAYIVPPRRNNAHGGRVVARRVSKSVRKPSGDLPTPRKKLKFSKPEWLQEWHDELTKIFKMALTLRLSLDIKGSGRYRFEFPIPGESWISTSKGAKQIDQVVFYGVFPRVEASFQDVRGGEWSKWEVLTDAVVHFAEGDDTEVQDEGEDVKELAESSELSEAELSDQDPSFETTQSKGQSNGRKRKGPSK